MAGAFKGEDSCAALVYDSCHVAIVCSTGAKIMKLADSDVTPFTLALPLTDAIPLVCDSPHSGTEYPADFHVNLPFALLQTAEDAWVHELWQAIPGVGGTLLRANFPRTYIDLNRELDDMDPAMLAEPWPGRLAPTGKSAAGCGLIWTSVRGQALYDQKLWVAQVQQRIDQYYAPYYRALEHRFGQLQEQFGVVWHLNAHSMPSDTLGQMSPGSSRPLADVVLGDLDGITCDPTYTGIVEDFFTARGYSVARNHPFKGMALLRRFGQPAKNRHSLQIELNRALYMNEATGQKNTHFARVQKDLADVSNVVADFVRSLL
jgi:N-formylglutamate amidohydrolase